MEVNGQFSALGILPSGGKSLLHFSRLEISFWPEPLAVCEQELRLSPHAPSDIYLSSTTAVTQLWLSDTPVVQALQPDECLRARQNRASWKSLTQTPLLPLIGTFQKNVTTYLEITPCVCIQFSLSCNCTGTLSLDVTTCLKSRSSSVNTGTGAPQLDCL
jgi:hypothetical protein